MPVLTLTLNCANTETFNERRIELDHAMPKQPLTLIQSYVDSPDTITPSQRQVNAKAEFDAAAAVSQAYYDNNNDEADVESDIATGAAAVKCEPTHDEFIAYIVDLTHLTAGTGAARSYSNTVVASGQDAFMPTQLWIELPFLTNFDSNSNHMHSNKGVFMIPSGEDTVATYGRGQRFTLSKDVSQNMQFEVYDQFGGIFTDRYFKIHLLFHYDKENLF